MPDNQYISKMMFAYPFHMIIQKTNLHVTVDISFNKNLNEFSHISDICSISLSANPSYDSGNFVVCTKHHILLFVISRYLRKWRNYAGSVARRCAARSLK